MANTCETCIYGQPLRQAENVICQKKGLVKKDFCCKKYEFDLTAKTVRKKRAPLVRK